jgi:hypothetical protein
MPQGPDTNPNEYVVYLYPQGSGEGCENQVYLLPPLMPNTFGEALEFEIWQLYTGPESGYGDYKVSNADFALEFGEQGHSSKIYANVCLTGANLWSCDGKARAALMQNFTSFLTEVEAKLEAKAVLAPGGTAAIAAQIADRIPAPPVETLFYRYSLWTGLAGGSPYVDVRPGMRLRIETEASQYVSPGSPLNGYVGGGTITVAVGSTPAGSGRAVTFDPFLGTISSPATAGAPDPIVVGGLVDLHPVGGARPHWRLFYPASMPLPSPPGSLGMAQNVTLAGAATLADMAAVTREYPNRAQADPANVYAVFSGRAMVVPEIQIGLAAGHEAPWQPTWVPLGTTLANVTERYAPLPLDPKLPDVSVRRPSSAANSGVATIRISRQVAALTPGMLDIPLAGGDLVRVLTSASLREDPSEDSPFGA